MKLNLRISPFLYLLLFVCFDREEEALSAVLEGKIKPGNVLVIRYEGPKGGPGMREMLSTTSAIY